MKIKLMESKSPKIFIDNNAMNKIYEYVDGIDKEIGWLGTVTRDGFNFTISDVFLFKQEVHGTTTEITPEGLNDFAMELMSIEGGLDIWNDMKMWGHSHVLMGVSPSGQDDSQLVTFESCGHDFFIRMITNKKGAMRLDLYDYETGIIYQELDYRVSLSDEEEKFKNLIEEKIDALKQVLNNRLEISEIEKNAIKAEIKDKVSIKAYQIPKTYNSYNGYGMNSNWSSYDDEYWSKSLKEIEKEDVKKNETDITTEEGKTRIIEIWESLKEDEVFELYSALECGEDIRDFVTEKLSFDEMCVIEDYVYQYVETHINDYLNWVDREGEDYDVQ